MDKHVKRQVTPFNLGFAALNFTANTVDAKLQANNRDFLNPIDGKMSVRSLITVVDSWVVECPLIKLSKGFT